MKLCRKWAALMVLLFVAIPAFGSTGGPKKWFHRKNQGTTYYHGNHIIVKHQGSNHAKAEHVPKTHR